MTDAHAIEVLGVSKQYPLFKRPVQALKYLMSLVYRGHADEASVHQGVPALNDINLVIKKGERVGVVGRNGAGKSTLLKLIAGDFKPEKGRFFINGSVYVLLPGSVSFSPEQSVEQNARQYLSFLGLEAPELESRIDDIRAFTELGEYFNQPVKNLSLGMRVRSEFAVATAQSADIVIIDEVLGAGDIYWSEKIARRMEALCAGGTTLLLVSHSLSQINRFCERAIWIERGEIALDSTALEVTKAYEGFLERMSWLSDDLDDKTLSLDGVTGSHAEEVLPDSGQTVTRWPGRGDVLISGVWFNGSAVSRQSLKYGDRLRISMLLRAQCSGVHKLRYLITIWDGNGKRFAVIENQVDEVNFDSVGSDHLVSIDCQAMAIREGLYDLTFTISDVDASLESSNEKNMRLDVLYKSFQLNIKCNDISYTKYPPLRLSIGPNLY